MRRIGLYSKVEAMYPEKIDFAGRIGDEQEIIANIADSDIRALLGKNTADICFDLGDWVVMNSVAAGVMIDLTGTVEAYEGQKADIPLMVHL